MVITQGSAKIESDGKRPLFVLLFIFMAALFISLSCEYEPFWNAWNIPACPPPFLDARIIATASESHALGYDPLFNNPQHPAKKVLNYPRIWHYLSVIGFNQSHVNVMGSILIILFFAGVCIFLLPKRFDYFSAFVLAVVILSPPVMLAIERGNPDLMIFFVLSLALTYFSGFTALSLFLFAAVLKIYPIFGLSYLLKEKGKKFWTLFIIGCSLFIFYALYTLDALRQVYISTEQAMPGAKSSFGVKVFSKALAQGLFWDFKMSPKGVMVVQTISYISVLLIFIIAFSLSMRKSEANEFKDGQHLDAFRVGACIYIGTFLLGASYYYRLLFLIFTVPQLLSWLKAKGGSYSIIPLLTLSALVFSSWSPAISRIIGFKLAFLLGEFSNWILLSGLFYLFFASVPDWLRNYLSRPFAMMKNSN